MIYNFFAFGFVFGSTLAFGGPISSGGGKSIVCFDAENRIQSASMLDTYEGRTAFGDKHIQNTNESIESYLDLAKSRLKNTAYGFLFPSLTRIDANGVRRILTIDVAIDHIFSKMRFLPSDGRLVDTNDSFEFIHSPNNCRILQAGYFADQNNIIFNSQIWEHFSNLDRAALILHEAIYWMDRQARLTQDSRRARRVVSLSLGKEWPFLEVTNGLPEHYLACSSVSEKPSFFALYTKGEFRFLKFFAINGDLQIDKAFIAIPFLANQDKSPEEANYQGSATVITSFEQGTVMKFVNIPDENSGAFGSKYQLKLSGVKTAYPEWTMAPEQIICSKR